jgi:prephenate dehydrogenase
MVVVGRVAIVGLGLIGGSLGMAIRRKRLAREVVGISRRASTLAQAKRLGAIDWGTLALRRAVAQADLLVLATPVERIAPLALRAARWMRPGSILTDVGSAKGLIVRTLERALPSDMAFVGAHPLAGSEQRGIAAASAQLFEGACCILTPTAHTDPRALRRVRRFWSRLGTRVLTLSPRRHDRLLAGVSHLPHLLAACLVQAAGHAPLAAAPRSFLDMTRVAKSHPALWDDIILSNREALLEAIGRFDHRWRRLCGELTRSDRAAVRRFLRRACAARLTLDDH